MFNKNKKLIFLLLLFSCIPLSMTFVSADNVTDGHIQSDVQNKTFEDNDELNNSNISEEYSNKQGIVYINPNQQEPHITLSGSIYNTSDKDNVSNKFVSKIEDNKIKKYVPKLIAKNKVFNKKSKIKIYHVVLKDNKGKVVKNSLLTLKIKSIIFKAKTNNKGKSTFKIKKLSKKGKYSATITYKGNQYYHNASKKVKIIIK